ncbi:MAG TPA: FdhF/YdeP family oxidoreductase [bacterium]|nr:FdhF/YdeP family oxidoreductase [bacterium]
MATPRLPAGGGFASIRYVLDRGRRSGGLLRLYRRLRSRNVCKTCALGMGGQRGGMVDEAGHFPSVCKKSVQVQAGDLAGPLDPERLRRTSRGELARLGSAPLQAMGRLAVPLLATPEDDRFRPVSWEDAIDRIVAAFAAAAPERTFFYMSGRSSNEAAFLLQLVARAYGTANLHNCSYYCHTASGVALTDTYGSGTASVVLEDLARADLALVAGANPASNHPRLVGQLVKLRRRGGRVIVVNPVREMGLVRIRVPSDPWSLLRGSDVSDLYLQPHVGGDVPLFRAILQGVVERGGVDQAFVDAHTSGWRDVREDLAAARRDDLLAACGVAGEDVDRAAEMFCAASHGILSWAMGLTHHAHGVDNVQALANLALARGWLGRPGCGLLPIRGHSNVQGIGSVGVSPALKAAFAARLEELFDIRVPADPGQDTFSSMQAAEAGNVDACLLLGGNLYSSNPDSAWAARALGRIPFAASLATHLNEGHLRTGATALLLPVLARDEETQETTQESMFNLVRRSEGGAPGPGEARSEIEIVSAIARGLLGRDRFDWDTLRSHAALRDAIAKVVPGYAAIVEGEFQIEGRTFHEPRFATDDGRARFRVTPVPEFGDAVGPGAFRLMTLRSEGQFNTVVYEEEDVYRGNDRRDVGMMAADDAERLGLTEGDAVTVRTDTGALTVRVSIAPIRPGNLAMYYPEANVLVPGRVDRRSGTPAFKSVVARVEAA